MFNKYLNHPNEGHRRLARSRSSVIALILSFILVTGLVAQVSPTADAAHDLAKVLLDSKTDADIARLLDERRETIGPALVDAISEAGDPGSERPVRVLRLIIDKTKAGGDRRTELRASFVLGKMLFESGAADDGAAVFNDALKDIDKDRPQLAGEFKINIGSVYKDAEEFEHALPLLQQGRALIGDAVDPHAEELRILATLGIAACAGELGKYPLALEELKRAETMYSANKAVLASLKNEYGVLYDFLGNATLSENSYRDAIALLQALPTSNETARRIATIQVNLGLLQTSKLGEYDDALANFRESKKVLGGNKQVLPLILMNESIAYRKLGRFKEGLEAAKSSFDLIPKQAASPEDKFKICNAYSQYAAALIDAGQYKEALDNAVTAEGLATGLPDLQWVILTSEGSALSRLGRADAARVAYDKAIAVVTDREEAAIGDEGAQATYFSSFYYPFYMRADLELHASRYPDALLLAERAKARSILAAVRGVRNGASAGLSEAERTEEGRLTQALTKANQALFEEEQTPSGDPKEIVRRTNDRYKAREDLEKFHLELYSSNRTAKIRRARTEITTVDDLAPALDDSSVALDFVVSEEAVEVLVVKKDRGGAIVLSGADLKLTGLDLEKLVTHFRSFMDPDPRGGFASAAKELYRRLIRPIESDLPKDAQLVIVPDGSLWDLPFAALEDESGEYLIQKHSITLAPSLFALSEIEARKQTKPKQYQRFMLALGDPDIGANQQEASKMGGRLGRLPYSSALVEDICKRFSSCSTKFVGAKATEKILKDLAAGSRIIQLSAHGVFDNGSPLYSHIVLAPSAGPGDPQDGLLEAWEIMDLDLTNTDMLVLSACETGRGKLLPGEGILGLSWASFIAGCPSVIATEWNVNDESTAILMKAFYSKLYSGGGADVGRKAAASKAVAMQEAMKQMITLPKFSRFSHPAFWSGFVVIGKNG